MINPNSTKIVISGDNKIQVYKLDLSKIQILSAKGKPPYLAKDYGNDQYLSIEDLQQTNIKEPNDETKNTKPHTNIALKKHIENHEEL